MLVGKCASFLLGDVYCTEINSDPRVATTRVESSYSVSFLVANGTRTFLEYQCNKWRVSYIRPCSLHVRFVCLDRDTDRRISPWARQPRNLLLYA